MPLIKKVFEHDFSKIYPLLIRFNESSLKPEDWKKIFESRSESTPDYYGYYLEDNDKAVGYIGMIFSKRLINDKKLIIANLTSWITLDEFKNHSIALLFKAMKSTADIITAFTPNDTACQIYKAMGFKNLESHHYYVFPTPGSNQSLEMTQNSKIIHSMLDVDCAKISKEHLGFKSIQMLFYNKTEIIFFILKKQYKKSLLFMEVQFCNNWPFFEKHAGLLSYMIFLKFKSIGLILEARFIKGKISGFSYKHKLKSPRRMYKGENGIEENIDVLYSELCFLH